MSFKQNTAKEAFAITASASALPYKANALYFGGAGSVTVTTVRGSSVQFDVQAGQILPLECTHVTAATATGIRGLLD